VYPYAHSRDPRFRLSRITWRTSVAYHPTEDKTDPPLPVRTFTTASRARGARRAPVARPLRTRARRAWRTRDLRDRRRRARRARGNPPLRCGHSALAPAAHGGRPPDDSPGHWPALAPAVTAIRSRICQGATGHGDCGPRARQDHRCDERATKPQHRWTSHPRPRSLFDPSGTRQGRLAAALRAALD